MKKLILPTIVRCCYETYAITSGSEGKVTLIFVHSTDSITNEDAGKVYLDYMSEDSVIKYIENGTYTVLGENPIVVTEPESLDVSTLTLKINTDATHLVTALADANEQAKNLRSTLQDIRNIFNKEGV